jgi:hypothetical protein
MLVASVTLQHFAMRLVTRLLLYSNATLPPLAIHILYPAAAAVLTAAFQQTTHEDGCELAALHTAR